ncbi:uncharacterized protein EI97DRAFT_106074 [Westerdykella ornata]|uniref:Uncharacterized protein n=1 Tax=Westerdykella ornata TaxID=318751 RepID=A0A6A6JTL2_WESOR|nr:uncharacterized protein EI97DRAFT_106074 [Westerdykella ornata]KAF2279960.1 hypothetical protein EI97DRAFT_106074 [Westerdykella ornata]
MQYAYLLSIVPALPLAAPTLQLRASTLEAIPGQAILKNSCPYDVSISVIRPMGDPTPGILQGGATYSEPLYHSTACPSPGCGGVSIKASAVGGGPVTQFEYTAAPDGNVYYDLSLIDCVDAPEGCVGHEQGLKAVAGPQCRVFHLDPGSGDEQQAYFVAENGYKPNAPVGGCPAGGGVAFELCAGSQKGRGVGRPERSVP